jgi:hypothetical protein
MNKKTLLSTLGVIVLGALGSGLWELAKPLLSWAWIALLTIATLGLDSLRDGMYAAASGGIGKPTGAALIAQSLGALIMLTGVAIIGALRRALRLQSDSLSKAYFAVLFVGSIALTIASSRTAYITGLATYVAKLEVIAAPHISTAEMAELRAEYVQIDNRADFLAHVAKLTKGIEAAGKKTPKREFF